VSIQDIVDVICMRQFGEHRKHAKQCVVALFAKPRRNFNSVTRLEHEARRCIVDESGAVEFASKEAEIFDFGPAALGAVFSIQSKGQGVCGHREAAYDFVDERVGVGAMRRGKDHHFEARCDKVKKWF